MMLLFVSHSFEQYLQDIHEVLGRSESSDLKLNPRKCTFATNKTVFLRYEISWDGIRPPSDRVDSIKIFPIPSLQRSYVVHCLPGLGSTNLTTASQHSPILHRY